MKPFIASTLNTAVNTLLQLDPASEKRLAKLQGVVVNIDVLPFHFTLQLLVNDQALHVQDEAILQPDITIRGTPLQMTALALNQDQKQSYFAEDIKIEGNAELAQDVMHLFSHLHIDWEELLSHAVGDAPAYHVSKIVRRAGKWLRQVDRSLTNNVEEYLHEETQWLPSREALQDLFNDIDALRLDVDRIEAKITALKDRTRQP